MEIDNLIIFLYLQQARRRFMFYSDTPNIMRDFYYLANGEYSALKGRKSYFSSNTHSGLSCYQYSKDTKMLLFLLLLFAGVLYVLSYR